MTRYILHGGYTSAENKLNKTYYAECTKGLKDGSTVLFIYFARREEEISRLFDEDKEKILETTKTKDLNFVVAKKEDFLNQLKNADTVYIRGGETKKLLNVLNKFPQFVNELKGKIVAGSTAGAYIISTCYHPSSGGGVHEGFGLLPVAVVCHYKSKIHPNVDDQIAAIEECPKKLERVVLKDFEWKAFEV